VKFHYPRIKKAYVEKQSYPKTTFQRVSLVAEPNILGAEAVELIHQRLSRNSVAERNLEQGGIKVRDKKGKIRQDAAK
jgi:hypothetical protein